MPSSVFLKSHCAWTHTVWIRLLIEMSSFMINEGTPCAWPHIIAVDQTYVLQLHDVIGHITLGKRFNLKHFHFIKWHHWCHRPKLCSSFVIDFMEQYYWTRLLVKFVIFYIWCCYSIVAYVHLRLRLHLPLQHPSVYNYIDYSSAVDLVALRVDLVCKYRASSDTYRSTLQPSSFIDSGCYPLLKLVKHCLSTTHCSVPNPWSSHCTVQCLRCVRLHCTVAMPRLFNDFAKHFDF